MITTRLGNSIVASDTAKLRYYLHTSIANTDILSYEMMSITYNMAIKPQFSNAVVIVS